MNTTWIYNTICMLSIVMIMGCSEDTVELTGFGTIKGVVVQVGTNEPLQNVRITTTPSTSTVFTNEEGVYLLNNVPVADYTLSAQREGLLAEFEPVSVLEDKEIEVVFEMDVETATNKPPTSIRPVAPLDNAIDQPINVALEWEATDPDEDVLEYTLFLRNDKDDTIELFENIKETTYTLSNLKYGVKYFWQVTVSDQINPSVNSQVFAFSTEIPNNNRILFTRTIGNNAVIFSADEEGRNEVQLTSEAVNSFRPRRDLNTGKIAFLRTVGTQTHLFVMNENTLQEQQVTTQVSVSGFNLSEIDFAWDRQGAALLFPNQDKLYTIQNDGSGLQLLYQTPDNTLISEVIRNEMTNQIALKTNNLEGYGASIVVINDQGTILETVVSGVSGALGGIDLSIDGTQLVYTQDVSGIENMSYRILDMHIFIYNFSTDTTTDLSVDKENGTNDLDPRFSPNEASVIFTNTSNDGLSVNNILKVANDGDSRTIIVENGAMADWE